MTASEVNESRLLELETKLEVLEMRKNWFKPFEIAFSKTPNGREIEVGTPTQDGIFPSRYAIFHDLTPTYENQCFVSYSSWKDIWFEILYVNQQNNS